MTQRKKLFFIINRLVIGGHSVDALSLAEHLAKEYQVTVVFGEKEKEEIEVPHLAERYPNVTFLKVKSLQRSIFLWPDVLAFQKLVALIKTHRPGIVHTHGFKSGLLGRLAAKRCGVPVIIHTYHGHHFHSYVNRFLSSFVVQVERQLARLTTKIIAISPQQAHEIGSVYRVAPVNKIKTVYLGIDKPVSFAENDSQTDLRVLYGISKQTIVVAIIGRLVPIKNLSFFVDIVERINRQNLDVCFLVVGDGHRKTDIQKDLSQRNIAWQEVVKAKHQTVIFTSWISNIAPVYDTVDIVVQTSLNEGTPVTLIEAQWCEKPVIATNVGGVADTVINEETGFLIDDFNLDAFIEHLQKLIENSELRKRMGYNGRIFVEQRFSKEKEVQTIDHLYKTCLLQDTYRP